MHVSAVAEEDRFKLPRFKSNLTLSSAFPFLSFVSKGRSDWSIFTNHLSTRHFRGSVGKAPSIAISLHFLQYSL